jgi:magnesium-transporting ATPase (P-type)
MVRRVQCPQCFGSIAVSMAMLGRNSQCIRCGAKLQVAPMYWRVLSVLSMVIGVCLMWEFGVPIFNIFVFAFPMWFLVLFVMVRIMPYIVIPRLELRDSGSFTTLGSLNVAEEENRTERMP